MNRIVRWSVLALALLVTAMCSLAQNNTATEKAVAALEQQWLKSQQTNNVALVEPLLAKGFTNTSSEGKVSDRAQDIAEAKATKYTSVDYTDLKVMVFGDTAIAIGNFRAKGTDASGKPLDANERFTDTWVKMPNGKWQCVASHQSPIKM
jgi:ketosteroid isomerase-like protein